MLRHQWLTLMEADLACFPRAQVSTAAGYKQVEVFRMYLWVNKVDLFPLHNHYQHPHQDCPQGHPRLRLDMEAPKAFCLQGSSLRRHRHSQGRQGLRHLQGLDLQSDSAHLQAKALLLESLQAFKLLHTGEPGRQ